MENFIFMQWNLSISPLKKCTLWYQVIATRSTSLHDFFQILFFCLGQNFFKGIYVVCFFCVLKRMVFFFHFSVLFLTGWFYQFCTSNCRPVINFLQLCTVLLQPPWSLKFNPNSFPHTHEYSRTLLFETQEKVYSSQIFENFWRLLKPNRNWFFTINLSPHALINVSNSSDMFLGTV